MPALLLSATGDWVLAIPWWTLSFVVGLAAFLLAHLCFVAALLPLALTARPSTPRIAAVVLMCLATIALLAWFWPHLGRDKLTFGDGLHRRADRNGVYGAGGATADDLDGSGGSMFRGVRLDDRRRPLHPGQRGIGRADLVVVRRGRRS